jgi:protoheme IX farnesyltransferase
MLPVVAGKAETKRQMLIYTVLLVPVAMGPALLGFAGWVYGAAALALGLAFVGAALAVLRDDTDRSAKRMFGFSIFYLFALFALLIADRVIGIVA